MCFCFSGSLGQGYDNKVAFWNFLAVGNYAGRFYKFSMQEVKATQDRVHAQLVQDAAVFEKEVQDLLAAGGDKAKKVVQALTDFTNAKGEYIMDEWRSLLPRLITTYHDGMIAMNRDQPMIMMKRLFFPKWWLQATGYFEHHGTFGPDTILFAPSPTATGTSFGYSGALLATALASSAVTAMVTLYLLRRAAEKRHEYTPIPSANL